MTTSPATAPGPAIDAGLAAELLPSLRAFAIPMPTKFRGTTLREGALLQGPAGWGEFSPFAEYGPRECARWLSCALEAAAHGWPEPVRDSVPVNVTVPAVGPDQAHAIVAGSGCRTAKVKVAEPGQPASDDIARVAAVRDAIGADGRVRIDANGGWNVDQAERMLGELSAFGLEYAEQPCATLDELAELRRRVDVPIAADESIRRAEDPAAGPGSGRGRHRGAEGAAARRRAAGAGDRRVRADCQSSCRAQWIRLSGWRRASRLQPRCPSFPMPADWPR